MRKSEALKALFSRHWIALIAALFVGLLMVSSPIAIRLSIGSDYRGIAPILSEATQDSAWYHAVIQETMMGGTPWNAILTENKHAFYPVPDFAERFLAAPGYINRIGADDLLLFWRFFLPFLLTLVLYAVGVTLVRSRLFSVASALIIMCATYVFYTPGLAFSILNGTGKALLYTIHDRPIHPQFEAPLLWGFLLLGTLAIQRTDRKRYWIGAGIILGVFTHSYFWAWTWGYTALAVLFIQSFIQNNVPAARTVLKTWLLGFLIGLPHLFILARSFFGGNEGAYAERLAAVSGHVFAPYNLQLPIILGLLVLAISRRFLTLPIFRFASTGLAASFIVLNQQVITGLSFQPDHYMQLIGSSFVLWVLCVAGWSRLSALQTRTREFLVLASVFVAILPMSGLQYRIAQQAQEYTAALQPFAYVAAWLNKNRDPHQNSVVFANQQIGMLVPAYTREDLWWHFYAMGVPTDQKRIEHAAFTWFALQGFSADDLRLAAERQPIDFTQYFTLTTSYEQRLAFIKNNLERLLADYEAFRKTTPLSEAVRAYRVTYVLFDKTLDHWDPSSLRVGEIVLDNRRFTLYRMAP